MSVATMAGAAQREWIVVQVELDVARGVMLVVQSLHHCDCDGFTMEEIPLALE